MNIGPLACSAFRNWKDRTGKLGADVFGCNADYQRQQGVALEECGPSGEGEASGDKDGGDEMSVEFNVLADAEMENEI
jgi:hypothetical protein